MLTGKPPITEIVLIPSTLASAIITNDAVLTAMPRSTFTVNVDGDVYEAMGNRNDGLSLSIN